MVFEPMFMAVRRASPTEPTQPLGHKPDAVAVDLTVEHVGHVEIQPRIPHAFTPERLLIVWVPP